MTEFVLETPRPLETSAGSVRFSCDAPTLVDANELHTIYPKLLKDKSKVRDAFARLWVDEGFSKLVEDESMYTNSRGRDEADRYAYNPVCQVGKYGLLRDHVDEFCQQHLNLLKIELLAVNMPEAVDAKSTSIPKKRSVQRQLHGMRVTICAQLQKQYEEEETKYVSVRIDSIVSKATNSAGFASDLLFWSTESHFQPDGHAAHDEFSCNVAKMLDYHYWPSLHLPSSEVKIVASETISLGTFTSFKDVHDVLKLVNGNMNRFSRTWKFRVLAGMLQAVEAVVSGEGNEQRFTLLDASDVSLVRYDNLYDYLLDDTIPTVSCQDLISSAKGGEEGGKAAVTSDVGVAVLRRLYAENFFSVILDQPVRLSDAFRASNVLVPHRSDDLQVLMDRGYVKQALLKTDLVPPRELLAVISEKVRVSYKIKETSNAGLQYIDGFMVAPSNHTNEEVPNRVEVGYFELFLRKGDLHEVPMTSLVQEATAKVEVVGKKTKKSTSEMEVVAWSHLEVDSVYIGEKYFSILQSTLHDFRTTNAVNVDDHFDCALFRGGMAWIESAQNKKIANITDARFSAEYLLST